MLWQCTRYISAGAALARLPTVNFLGCSKGEWALQAHTVKSQHAEDASNTFGSSPCAGKDAQVLKSGTSQVSRAGVYLHKLTPSLRFQASVKTQGMC